MMTRLTPTQEITTAPTSKPVVISHAFFWWSRAHLPAASSRSIMVLGSIISKQSPIRDSITLFEQKLFFLKLGESAFQSARILETALRNAGIKYVARIPEPLSSSMRSCTDLCLEHIVFLIRFKSRRRPRYLRLALDGPFAISFDTKLVRARIRFRDEPSTNDINAE